MKQSITAQLQDALGALDIARDAIKKLTAERNALLDAAEMTDQCLVRVIAELKKASPIVNTRPMQAWHQAVRDAIAKAKGET